MSKSQVQQQHQPPTPSQSARGPKMGPFDIALYGVILCIHYPLKLTFATYRTSKAAVVTTVSLPRRTLDYALTTISSIKRTTESGIVGSINLVKNTAVSSINLTKNVANGALTVAQNVTSYAFGFLKKAKAEANYQFETKINEPKLEYEKALKESAKEAQGWLRTIGDRLWGFVAPQQAGKVEPKNEYEKSYTKFQAAAFETERQTLKQEIMKLNELLKRSHFQNNSDTERVKCDKQIYDLQDQLTRMHLSYTQQKQQLFSDFEKERLQYKQEIQNLKQQLAEAQIKCESLSKEQVTNLENEHTEYRENTQKLLKEISSLREELLKYEEEQEEGTTEGEEDTDSQDFNDADDSICENSKIHNSDDNLTKNKKNAPPRVAPKIENEPKEP